MNALYYDNDMHAKKKIFFSVSVCWSLSVCLSQSSRAGEWPSLQTKAMYFYHLVWTRKPSLIKALPQAHD